LHALPIALWGRDDRSCHVRWKSEVALMLTWALIFLIVALIAGAFGFWGVASTATSFAKILFIVFLALFLGSLVLDMFAAV
jgi:uncharacterized membrane protein YtjA (UPF0391 family)